MLDLRMVTDLDVRGALDAELCAAPDGSDRWRLFGAARLLSDLHSFSATRTYPRPDHPDPRKRLPLAYLLVAIIVSLRTTLENEQAAMDRVIERFRSEADLMAAKPEALEDAIRPAGMASTKAFRIISALHTVSELEGGLEVLATWAPADARAYLLGLPGFGPKAADCLMTIGLGHASMVVDVNVFRMAVSLLGLEWKRAPSYSSLSQVSEVKSRLDAAVGDDAFHCQIIHTLFLLEGRRLRGVHLANQCQIRPYCRSCESATAAVLF